MKSLTIIATLIASTFEYQFDRAKAFHAKMNSSPNIIPVPKDVTHGFDTQRIGGCGEFTTNIKFQGKVESSVENDIHQKVNQHIQKMIFFRNIPSQECISSENDIKELRIEFQQGISQSYLPSKFEETDESYSLSASVNQSHISLIVNQYSGIVRALSTLSQLIHLNESSLLMSHLPLQINDAPRYPYRGFMLDTSRHYFSVDGIKTVLDALALSKFNVLHWHIVDDDSFAMESKTFPNLTFNGAFTKDNRYTRSMIKEIVDYATTLAIRVIPEFDNPGHVRAVSTDPYFNDIILCANYESGYNLPNAYKFYGGPPTGVMDPSRDKTYELLQGLFRDLNEVFPDAYLHLGGDEVPQHCYNESAMLPKFMKDRNISTYNELVIFHQTKAREVLSKVNPSKTALYWSNEPTFYQRFKDDDILVYWGLSKDINTLNATYPKQKFVIAAEDYYYLDCGLGNKYGAISHCDPYKNWFTIYSLEPSDHIQDERLLGGEVSAWSELFREDSLHQKVWPRAASLADRYWGPKPAEIDLISIQKRLNALADLMRARGIPTSPITGRWCEINVDRCFAKAP